MLIWYLLNFQDLKLFYDTLVFKIANEVAPIILLYLPSQVS